MCDFCLITPFLQNKVLSQYQCELPPSMRWNLKRLAVCVRSIEGAVDDITSCLLGSSAIFFVLPPALSEDPELVGYTV